MAETNVSIANRALVMVGADPIESFDDGSTEATVISQIYQVVLDELLASHRWRAFVGQSSLSQLTATPVAGWDYAYQLPTDRIEITRLYPTHIKEWDILEDKLYCNYDGTITIEYTFEPDEGDMPGYFVSAFVRALAASICVPLTESPSRAKFLYDAAQESARVARRTDSTQRTNKFKDFSLVSARGASARLTGYE